jgi:hypothetical protein
MKEQSAADANRAEFAFANPGTNGVRADAKRLGDREKGQELWNVL